MKKTTASLAAVFGLLLLVLGSQHGFAQAISGTAALEKEIQSLRQGQEAIQKDIQIIKDILTGKKPPLENVLISIEGSPVLGDANASIAIVEFADYQCPFCGRHSSQTLPQVMDEYVKSGKVQYIYKDFPLESLHPLAMKAAEAARCAGEENKYWEMHDRLYKNQQALDVNELQGHATVLGLDAPKFQQCLDSGKYTAQIRENMQEGQKYGVRGTPAFFLGKIDPKESKVKAVTMLSGAQPYTAFQQALDKLLSPPEEVQPKVN